MGAPRQGVRRQSRLAAPCCQEAASAARHWSETAQLLKSFKALGGAYAVSRLVAGRPTALPLTITCATDGNLGRSVAWGARQFGCRCFIFVHECVSRARIAANEHYCADVRRVKSNYDDYPA